MKQVKRFYPLFVLLLNACAQKNDSFRIENSCQYRSDLELEGLNGKVRTIEEISYFSIENDDISDYSITFYSVNGLKDSIQHFENGEINWTDTYIRDVKNKLLKVTRKLKNRESFELRSYIYNGCQNVIEYWSSAKSYILYDENYLITKINRQTLSVNDTLNSMVSFKYVNSKLTSWHELYENGDSSVAKFNSGFANFSKNEFYKNKKLSAEFNYTYTSFDEFENWTTSIKNAIFYYDRIETFENLIERKIEYYP